MSEDHKILIVKPSSLGDIIHAFPALSIIRKCFPTSYIAWLINENFKEILEGHPYLDEIIVFPRYVFLEKGLPFFKELKRRRFDITIDLQGLFRSSLISVLSGAKERIGFKDGREFSALLYTRPLNVDRHVLHAVDRNVRLAASICGGIFDIDFTFNISHRAVKRIEELLQGLDVHNEIIALNPVTRWHSKMWMEERWAKLADELSEKGSIVFLGARGEEGVVERIRHRMKKPSHSLAGKLTLQELAVLLSRSRLLITVDSGTMHLASALHVPIISLFGPTNPAYCGPYGQDGGIIKLDIKCSGCYRTRCREMKCMKNIGIELVLAKALKVLSYKP
jgi:lipopolysaccharide heptosyltransferase I